ncbi:MAG: carboxymuconolactone decarboxylase family protein [Gammaproteobacteria bacterium]|nr:carboxymuconolactone decarboxylase family protein [Gammaproteobacteria bacterium]
MRQALTPINEPFSAEVAEIFKEYPQQDGYILQLFRVFANSLRFLKKGTVNLLDRDGPLSLRERELVILRVCANNNCEYEWGVHVAVFAAKAGISADQIAATCSKNHEAECWNIGDALLIRVVDELSTSARLSPETKSQFETFWDLEQQLEILALAGNYHTISFVANVAGIEGEGFGARFPSD